MWETKVWLKRKELWEMMMMMMMMMMIMMMSRIMVLEWFQNGAPGLSLFDLGVDDGEKGIGRTKKVSLISRRNVTRLALWSSNAPHMDAANLQRVVSRSTASLNPRDHYSIQDLDPGCTIDLCHSDVVVEWVEL